MVGGVVGFLTYVCVRVERQEENKRERESGVVRANRPPDKTCRETQNHLAVLFFKTPPIHEKGNSEQQPTIEWRGRQTDREREGSMIH